MRRVVVLPQQASRFVGPALPFFEKCSGLDDETPGWLAEELTSRVNGSDRGLRSSEPPRQT